MKILYIHQYYNTPETGGPLRSYYLSKALKEAGHDVELITAHNSKQYLIKTIEGVKVHYLPVPYQNSYSNFLRIWAFLKFLIKSVLITRNIKADLCFATSTPLTVGAVALWLKFTRKIPYVFEVRDLWPAAPIQIGAIKNPLLKKLLFAFEKRIYQEAKTIIALSPGIADSIHLEKPDKKVLTLPNMADTCFYTPPEAGKTLKTGLTDKITITYFGAAGPANNLKELLNTADYFNKKGQENTTFLIVAKGKELKALKNAATEKILKNVEFREYVSRADLKKILAASDFTYISFLNLPVLKSSSPNKLFDSLAAGVPVISNIDGWWMPILEEYQAGFYYNPNNPEELIQRLKAISDNFQLASYRKNSRKLAEEKFSKEQISREFVKAIEESI